MRLSEWRKRAPSRDSVSPKVLAVVDPALGMLGAPGDPDCWVVWGDDPGVRYMILAPTPSGLVQLNVRVNVAGRRTARQRQGRALEPRAARGARARDPGRPSPGQLPGRDPGPQRRRRHGRRHRRLRPGALRGGRRPSCAGDLGHATATGRHRTRALGDGQGRSSRGRRWDCGGRDGAGQGSGGHGADGDGVCRQDGRPEGRGGHEVTGRRVDVAPVRLEGDMTAIACVIFDLDGVLVDSEIWWDEVRAAFAAEHGRTWTADDQAAVMGANSAGLGADHARAPATSTCPRPTIERAIVDGVVERYRTRGRAPDRWRRRGRPADRRRPSGRARVLGASRGDRRGARRDRA